jgi:alkylation response protein AidB-like acyl-CoA dehydrogenase
LTEDQKLLVDSARQFIEKEHSFAQRWERARTGEAFSPVKWRAFGEMGWLGMALPESVGRLGLSAVEIVLLAEELGRGLVLEPFAACGVLPARLLAKLGGPRHAGLLEASIGGAAIIAAALSEPQARGAVAEVELRAEPVGGGWRLTGCKSLVIGAPEVAWFLVSARTGGDRGSRAGLSLFLVGRGQFGVSVQGDRLMDWSSSADVRFESAVVAREALIGEEGEAAAALQEAVDEAILALCAEAVGAIEGSIDLTATYLSQRRQFGVPIATFQALQHRIADMAIELTQARSAVYRALGEFFQPDARRRTLAVSGCKAMVTRIGKWATSQGIQLHGGYGLTEEYQVGHYFKRLLVIDAMFGRMDHHLNRYARALAAEAVAASRAKP